MSNGLKIVSCGASRVVGKRLRTKVAAALCGVLTAVSLSARAVEIRIAVGADPSFVAFFVAKQEKLFEKQGLDVKLLNFAGGGVMLDALPAGQAVMSASTESTTIVRMGRADIRAVAIIGESGDNLKLMARKEIANPKGIKVFGVVPGGVFEYLNVLTSAKYGLDPSGMKTVKSGPPELPALLVRGDIDAFWIFEPLASLTEKQGARVLAQSKDVGYTYATWVSAYGPWLKDNKADAEKVLKALAQACEITTANPQKAAEAMHAQMKLPVAQSLEILKLMTCKARAFTDADLKGYDAIADFLANSKITASRVKYRDLLDKDFYKP